MEDIRLPRHVIDRLEHRWASRLQQDAKARRSGSMQARHVQIDRSRAVAGVVKRARGANSNSERA